MGRPKLTLLLGQRTVVEHVVATLMKGGATSVVVVVGPGQDDLRALAEKAGANVLELAEDTLHMRDTVQRGLDWLEQRYHPLSDDGWLLLPADHPCADEQVVRAILLVRKTLAVRDRRSERSIVVPVFEGQRGHPVWISWQHVRGLRELPPGMGLNVYLRQHGDEILELPVSHPSILWDLDTPEDYEKFLGQGL